MVVPGCSGREDMTDFLSRPSPGISDDVGGLSNHSHSVSWMKEEKPPTDTDSDSCGALSDEDQVRKAKRRRLRVSSRTAQTIVDIQRNLDFSVDRLEQHWSGMSSMDQCLGGVTNSIQELVAITHRLGSVLGQNIQSSGHGGWDSNITNNHKNQPSLPSQREANQGAFTNQDDEEELFGRYIGTAIRKLTDRSRSRAKLKIQQVIFSLQEADGRNVSS